MAHPLLFPVVQSLLQPSPSAVLPSSHCSVPAVMLSPHTVMQTELETTNPTLQAVQIAVETKHYIQFRSMQGTTSHAPLVVFRI
jgi:hypothetical protein